MIQAHRLLLKWARTLHVYLTLFGFALLLFFAVTGFMLNHETWFLPTQTTTGTIPKELLDPPENREEIVKKLQKVFRVSGELESFERLEDKNALQLVFKTNDPETDTVEETKVVIQRADGATVVTSDSNKGSRERITIVEGEMPLAWLVPNDKPEELKIVEKLRKDFGARGEVQGPPTYEKSEGKFGVVFKAPGYQATVEIDADNGRTTVTHQSRGVNGVLLDLHRGKESGVPWSVVIDAVSILFVIVSITGLILWSSLRSRAQYGIALLLLGLAVGLAIYFAWVPR